jgi:hypothetical protein
MTCTAHSERIQESFLKSLAFLLNVSIAMFQESPMITSIVLSLWICGDGRKTGHSCVFTFVGDDSVALAPTHIYDNAKYDRVFSSVSG